MLSLLVMPCWIFAIRDLRSRRHALGMGFLLSAMVAWGGFLWILYVTQYYGNLPFAAALTLLLLYCLVAAPQMVAFFFLGERLRFRIERLPLFLRPLYWAALYTGLEYLAHFLKIFPENLGNTLIAFLPLAQAASLGGASLLTFFAVWTGASLAYTRLAGRRGWPSLAAAVAVLVAAYAWGQAEIQRLETAAVAGPALRIGIVQPSTPEMEKLSERMPIREALSVTLRHLFVGTEKVAAEKPDLILWSETAYPLQFSAPGPDAHALQGYANLVTGMVKRTKVPLLFGAYEGEGTLDFNAAILLGQDSAHVGSYRKQVLLIFGEYMPFSGLFPALKGLNPQMGDFGRGRGPYPLPFSYSGGTVPLGINICYEAIMPEYMRSLARNGAQVFVNLTKDSWFGNTFEPWQHFQLTALRAIEHRIPLVRSTNTGLSGVVLATGKTQLLSDPYVEKAEVFTLPYSANPKPTLYTLLGEWFAWLCLGISVGFTVWAFRK